MTFKSYSQAGQDQWVYDTLVKGWGMKTGTFLDVGCNHPIEINNTYGLEQIGWTGLLVDNDMNCIELCERKRKNPVLCCDATVFDFPIIRHVNYLSLDVDSATVDTLKNILHRGISFDAATIEHDSYRFGPVPRDLMRELLLPRYNLAKADVLGADGKSEFEDWWISK